MFKPVGFVSRVSSSERDPFFEVFRNTVGPIAPNLVYIGYFTMHSRFVRDHDCAEILLQYLRLTHLVFLCLSRDY